MIENRITIKDLPEDEQPYQKCVANGPSSLSDAELLAVIIRSGSANESSTSLARRILSTDNNGLLELSRITYQELTAIKGIGLVKAAQILCVAELTRRMTKATIGLNPIFDSPDIIARYYMEDMRHLKREQLIAVFLDTKLRKISDSTISIGTVNSSLMSPREIFREALSKNAVSIVLLHNHPSGDPTPSRSDIQSTEKASECGKMLGIRIEDHIIIGDNCFFSMKKENLYVS